MCIWCISIIDDEISYNKWFNLEELKGVSRQMSTTAQGRLVLVERHRNRVLIINSQGILEKSLETRDVDKRLLEGSVLIPADITYIRHALETTERTFLLCHGDAESTEHRVCEVDISDNKSSTICNFGGMCGTGVDDLYRPFYMALRKTDRSVFVADSENMRILLLDKNLKKRKPSIEAGIRRNVICYNS